MSTMIDDMRAFADSARNGGCCEGGRCGGSSAAVAKDAEKILRGEVKQQTESDASILAEADQVAGQNRSRDYGHPFPNHERIAAIWNVQLGPKLNAPIEPREVALMMIGLKLARLTNSPLHRDSMVDICGYAKCWEMIGQWEDESKRL